MEYKEIKKKDGTVIVFCRFEELLKEAFEANTMEEVETHQQNNGEYIIHCPFCKAEGHKKHKLYIKSDLTVGHCFVCHRAFVNITDEVKVDYKIPEFFSGGLFGYNNNIPRDLVRLSDPNWTLDKFYNEFDDFDQNGYNYLVKRNPYLSELYKILGFKFWQGNVVMPFFDNQGSVFYYQIRFTGNSKIRYFFPPISYKPCYIIKKNINKALIISEGIFDSIANLIMAPNYTPIAILGSSVSDYQLNMIRQFVPEKILVYMDETKLSIGVANKLRSVIDYCPINIIKSDGEDPEEALKRKLKYKRSIQWIK